MAEIRASYKPLNKFLHDMVVHIQTVMVPLVEKNQLETNKLINTVEAIKRSLDSSIKDLVYIHRDYPVVPQQPPGFTTPDSKRGKYDKPEYSPGSAPLETGETPRAEPPPTPKKAGRRTRRQQRRMKPKH